MQFVSEAHVAILLLEGDALSWWKSVSGDDSMITWEVFKEKFMWHHFPASVRDERENAFYQFKQKDLSIDEYIATFTDLVRNVLFLQR